MIQGRSRRRSLRLAAVALALTDAFARADGPKLTASATPADGAFPLVGDKAVAAVRVDAKDATVVRIAADLLAADVERVTACKPTVETGEAATAGPAVIIGTVGRSAAIDALVAAGKLEVSAIRGKWEAYQVTVVTDPSPGVPQALVIVGSDPRGTAYGVFTLSEAIGVSPWYWWADVPPVKKAALYVGLPKPVVDAPAVKYRGIFINDEDWGLEPWAAKTFEPEVGNIGPKTYAKVFELLLRLKANLIWPGMHACTTAFHQVPGNAKTADDYAIVLGSSHAEPMLRNNVGEWKAPHDQYNFISNRDDVLNYWEQRVKERTGGDSLFTLGMRGIHDSPIVGPKGQKERVATLQTIFAEQRAMLAKYIGGGDATKVGQIFCPYKEVLDDYLAGLKVPDDVTIVWPDDNFGYVRRFATDAERARSGGLGIYYHASYLGSPVSWLWVDTMSPALMWSEMTRAYEQGARKVWVVNVGDIKNTERSAEFFLDLAWHADRTGADAPARHQRDRAARDFGDDNAAAIATVLTRMQAINFDRKVEFLQWHPSLKPYKPTALNETEIAARLKDCADLLRDSDAIAAKLPAEARDAYFELVGYPVAITAAANAQYFRSELARADVARGRPADSDTEAATAADLQITELTRHYNDETANGKWQRVVSAYGFGKNDWKQFKRDTTTTRPAPTADNIAPPAPEQSPLPRPEGAKAGDFVERDRVVSINAGNYNNRHDLPAGAGWRVIPSLGRTGSAVTVMPSTVVFSPEAAPSLDYRVHVATAGEATLHVRLVPTHPLVAGRGLRLAIMIDDAAPLPLAVTKGFETDQGGPWADRVLANATEATARLPAPLTPGWHTLRLVAVDAGVVVDKIVLDLGGLRPSYDGPPETRLP